MKPSQQAIPAREMEQMLKLLHVILTAAKLSVHGGGSQASLTRAPDRSDSELSEIASITPSANCRSRAELRWLSKSLRLFSRTSGNEPRKWTNSSRKPLEKARYKCDLAQRSYLHRSEPHPNERYDTALSAHRTGTSHLRLAVGKRFLDSVYLENI